jgi:phage tail-like protein
MEGRARISRRMRCVALATVLVAVGAGAVATSGFGQLGDEPLTASRFALTIDGVQIATFGELSDITSEVKPVEFLESSDKEVILKRLPGQRRPPTVTLKRGLTSSLELWTWHEVAVSGSLAARRSVSLVAFDAEGRPISKWFLTNAWPSRLKVGTTAAGSSRLLTEEVTIVAENIQRVAP